MSQPQDDPAAAPDASDVHAPTDAADAADASVPPAALVPRPRLRITYCTQCRWLLRATWLAGELLTTFTTDLGEVALRPGVGGVFTVEIDDEVVWDRAVDKGFPDLAPLKRLVRDRVAPGRSLGHTDRAAAAREHAGA